MNNNILAIIPARGGSKSIKGKNLAMLGGKPLIQYTVEAALGSKLINRIVLSSDDRKIIHFCRDRGVEAPFIRPRQLACDTTAMIDVVKHAVRFLGVNERYRPQYVILLQPTSPFRTAQDIDKALTLLIRSGADSVVSVQQTPHRFNPYSQMRMEGRFLKPFLAFPEKRNTRQLKPKFYARNGPAVLAFRIETLNKKGSLYGKKIRPYLMAAEKSIDIDDVADLKMAAMFLSQAKRST